MVFTHDEARDEAVIRFLRAVHQNGLRVRDGLHDEEFEGLTHVEAARLAGLSRPSVHSFAKRMRGKVLRDGTLAIAPRVGYAIGVDFGRAHHTRVALSDIHGVVVEVRPNVGTEERRLSYQTPTEALDYAEREIRSMVDQFDLNVDRLIGVGISLPGPVRDHIAIGPDAGSWRHLSAADELARRLGWGGEVEFATGNDAYLSALAESLWGGGQVSDHTVYVKWSADLRAALIVDGQLYTGHSGTAGELAHVIVDPDSEESECEQCQEVGCVHKLAQIETIARVAGDERMRAADIVSRAHDDAQTLESLKTAARGIGKAVAPYVAALNPELVVLGGALGSRAFPLVLEDITAEIREQGISNVSDVKVVGARLERYTAARGAIALALLEFGPSFLRRQFVEAESPKPQTHEEAAVFSSSASS